MLLSFDISVQKRNLVFVTSRIIIFDYHRIEGIKFLNSHKTHGPLRKC